MRTHRNARLTWHSRLLMVWRVVVEGWSKTASAAAAGVTRTTLYRWLRRWRSEGEAGLFDRSSAPHRVANRTPGRQVRRIERLRRGRMSGVAIAARMGMASSTVGGILRGLGLSRARDVEPREPARRYERATPGELLHLDIKKLGRFQRPGKRVHGSRKTRSRGAGWEYVHVCVDDHSRVAYVEVLGDEHKERCAGFLRRAVAWYERRGVSVKGVMTDNGSGYVSKHFGAVCDELAARHLRTRPYRPQTNGKAERFIQTLQREWAYARPYRTAAARARALGPWLEQYNRERPHRSIGRVPPITRLPGQV